MRIFISLFFILSLILTACGSKIKEKAPQIRPDLPSFSKPAGATSRVEGPKVAYCLWFNPNKWMILDTPFDTEEEKSKWDWILVLIDPQNRLSLGKDTPTRGTRVYIYSDTEKNRSFEDIKNTVQKTFLGGKEIQEFEDLGSEERLVNGLLVYSWKFKARFKDMGTKIFYNYYTSGPKGSASVITYTNPIFWKENEKDVDDLLNGLCQLKK